MEKNNRISFKLADSFIDIRYFNFIGTT